MHNGGAKRMMLPCVGFANKPFSAIFRHTSQARPFSPLPFLLSSITMASKRPLPRTELTQVLPTRVERPSRNCCPRAMEFSTTAK